MSSQMAIAAIFFGVMGVLGAVVLAADVAMDRFTVYTLIPIALIFGAGGGLVLTLP